MSKLVDLTGRQFGRLTVLERDMSAKRTSWFCRCACGREKSVAASNLVSGKSTSCGCASADTRRGKPTGKHLDITGQKFGRLTALEFVRHDRWRWRCDCGKIVEARPSMVKTGEIRSCGCLQSELRRADVNATVQHADGTCITTLRSIMAGKLRSTNTTGHTGVTIRHRVAQDVYVARIIFRGQRIHLGTYRSMEEAVAARKRAEIKYFGRAIADYEDKQDL